MNTTTDTEPSAAPPDGKKPPRSGRVLKILLIVSLSINLLIAGAVGAHYFRGQFVSQHLLADDWERGRELLRGLPRERRRMILEKLRSRRGEFRQGREAIRAARERVGAVLRDTKAGGYEAAFSSLADAESRSVRKFRALMAEVANDLSAKERRSFADHLERPPSKMRHRR